MKRSFEEIMDSLKTTIASYKYFVDYDKVFINAHQVYDSLELLNSLIGTKEKFDSCFIQLIHSNPKALRAIPVLLAMRDESIKLIDGGMKTFSFNSLVCSDEEYLKFIDKTGLKNLLAYGQISNLKDYVIGVEVGLDSNARKNRTGKSMETLVSDYLSQFDDIKVIEQATKHEIKSVFGFSGLDNIDLTEGNKTAEKRFDFAVKYNDFVILIETNFYGSSGSKLNETARSYQYLSEQIKQVPGCEFIWITDGVGWKTAKNNLRESYEHQNSLLTLYDLEVNNLIKSIYEYADEFNARQKD